MLAPCPGGAHRVDTNVGGGDVDVDLLGLGQHGDGGGRGVHTAPAFGNGNALDAVDAALIFQPREDAAAFDMGGDGFDAAQLAFLHLDDVEIPAAVLRVAAVHVEQIARKKRRLIAARAGPDFNHGGFGVGGVLGQQGQPDGGLRLGQLRAQLGQFFFGQLFHFGVGQHGL